MPALAYVDGRYGPLSDAAVSIEDRGFQFADSVYEVIAVLDGRMLDADKHVRRLRRNLAALFIDGTPGDAALGQLMATLVARSRLRDALLYLQISRGAARRDHGFPAGVRPTLAMTIRRFDFAQRVRQQAQGIAVVSRPDIRWGRCDLKTTGLLAAVLAKEEARRAGAFEAVFVAADGMVTEGSSTNIWMVDRDSVLLTHPQLAAILPGVARDTLLALARADGIAVRERAFTLDEAQTARELLLTSTTAPILPIVRLDGVPVADGRPGPMAARLAALSWADIARQTGWSARPGG